MTENAFAEIVSVCAFEDAFSIELHIVKYHDMNRAALIEQIEEARTALEKLLTLLQSTSVARDRFASHLYQSRREYRRGVRNSRQIRQADRALRNLKFSNRPEYGLPRRFSTIGGPTADRRLIAAPHPLLATAHLREGAPFVIIASTETVEFLVSRGQSPEKVIPWLQDQKQAGIAGRRRYAYRTPPAQFSISFKPGSL